MNTKFVLLVPYVAGVVSEPKNVFEEGDRKTRRLMTVSKELPFEMRYLWAAKYNIVSYIECFHLLN